MFKNKKQDIDTKRHPRISLNETPVYSSYHSRKSNNLPLKNSYQPGAQKQNKTNKDKKPKGLVAKLPTYLVFGLVIFSAVYLLSFDGTPTVLVKGESELIVRKLGDYELAATREVNSNLLKKFKPFFSSKKMTQSLLTTYPELKNVDVRVPVVDRSLIVVIELEQPAMLVNDSLNQFLVSDSGKVIAPVKNIDSSNLASLPTVDDNVLETIELGQYILPKSTLEFIDEVLYQLRVKSIVVENISLPAVANELHIQVDRGYFIKFNVQEDATWQAGSYLALLEYFESGNDRPNEYVDVRVGEKVFYR
jgi:hypothetical protein